MPDREWWRSTPRFRAPSLTRISEGARTIRTDYTDSVQSALDSIGRSDGALGSGSASALALSLAVECLSLQLTLSAGRAGDRSHADYYAQLAERIAGWRTETHACFSEDPEHFRRVIEARRGRDAAEPGEAEAGFVRTELVHLQRANRVLLRLLEVSIPLRVEADRMMGGVGSRQGRAEASTAKALAEAVTNALTVMLAANCRAGRSRQGKYGLELDGLSEIAALAERLPEGTASADLRDVLDGGAAGV